MSVLVFSIPPLLGITLDHKLLISRAAGQQVNPGCSGWANRPHNATRFTTATKWQRARRSKFGPVPGFVVRVSAVKSRFRSPADSVRLSLEEAYQHRRSRSARRRCWARTQNLQRGVYATILPITAAAHEIAAAEELSPQHPMILLLKRRLALLT